MLYILEDNPIMAECISAAITRVNNTQDVKIFSDTISAIESLNTTLPDLIFLDILLTGPDGFTFLNELASYRDTAQIPIVIVSTLDFQGQDLSAYGVVGILNKETMTPADIISYVQKYTMRNANHQKVIPPHAH